MKTLHIVKIGGNVLNHAQKLDAFLDEFVKLPNPKILIHGGGVVGTEYLSQLGIESKYHNGRRITDTETMNVLGMVYGGLINKNLICKLNYRGNRSLGLTGADLEIVKAKKRVKKEIDFGLVGDVDKVDCTMLLDLLKLDNTLVIAPLSYNREYGLLNTNADTVAQEIAVSLKDNYSVCLIYSFELNGVLENIDDVNSVYKKLSVCDLDELFETKRIHNGMIAKLDNIKSSLLKGVQNIYLRRYDQINNDNAGTEFSL